MEQPHIKRVIDYIESHLKEELDNALLADIAGYSEFHFLRLFREIVRLTPADYIRKRRISEIVRRIGQERHISELAFEYGFHSKENFTRAFKREHKILPTEFKRANCSLWLYQPFTFDEKAVEPKVSMCYLKGFSVVAYPCGNKELPPDFWNKYNAEKRSQRLSGGEITEDYGVMCWNCEKSRLDYYIGICAERAKGDISGTVRLDIAGGLYAAFDTPPASQHDFVSVIHRTWSWIYNDWLPGSGYRRGEGFEMECYRETSRKYSERIYVPLERS